MRRRWLALILALAPAAVAGAQGVAYEGGLGLATGQYIFTARTTSWTLSNGLSVRTGPFTVRASVPLFVSGGTAALRGYDPPFSVGITGARLASPAMWGVTGVIGLTETTPDVAVSLSWRVRFR